MLKKVLNVIMPTDPRARRAEQYREIIRESARMGGTLFGPVQKGNRREFFCLDRHTWVWHEEWTDASSIRHSVTTRYDIRPNGILKAQDGQTYQPVTAEEAHRLYGAARTYRQRLQEQLAPILG